MVALLPAAANVAASALLIAVAIRARRVAGRSGGQIVYFAGAAVALCATVLSLLSPPEAANLARPSLQIIATLAWSSPIVAAPMTAAAGLSRRARARAPMTRAG